MRNKEKCVECGCVMKKDEERSTEHKIIYKCECGFERVYWK